MSGLTLVRDVAVAVILAGTAVPADPPDPPDLRESLERQLDQLQLDAPCPSSDDAWRMTSPRRPPPRIPCPFTAQTFGRTRRLWVDAAQNAQRLPIQTLRARPAAFAGTPYVLSGAVESVSYEDEGETRVHLRLADGEDAEAVTRTYVERDAGAHVDAVGLIAGARGRTLVLAASSLVAEHEVAAAAARWLSGPPRR